MKRIFFFFLAAAGSIFVFGAALAYTVPEDDSRARYFYVFGPAGDALLGADNIDHEQVLYIDAPQGMKADVLIYVYDSDTGGFRDQKPDPQGQWDTITEFTLYGQADKVLAQERFGESGFYDRNYYRFGPYPKEKGQEIGGYYRFKLVAKSISGEDENLFNVSIFPDTPEAFSDKIMFRLSPQEGDKMYFYPRIPAGAKEISVENYDIDAGGGISQLYDKAFDKTYRIKDSSSGQWARTTLAIPVSKQPRYLEYIVTKKTQKYANAGIRIRDDKGNPLPIYFKPLQHREEGPRIIARPAPEPPREIKCNEFTFDATRSYSPDNQKLSFLWDFGDGTPGQAGLKVAHIYEKGGDYSARVSVDDGRSLSCSTNSALLKIHVNTPPLAKAGSDLICCTNVQYNFDAAASSDADGDKLDYFWDFGDGSSSQGIKVIHTYLKSGAYNVVLRVDDNSGIPCSASADSFQARVSDRPVAAIDVR